MPEINCKDPDQHENLLGIISTIVVYCLDSVLASVQSDYIETLVS